MGIPRAFENCLDNSAPGNPCDIADDLGELEVHLFEGFFHVLDVLAGVANQAGALPQVRPQLAGLLIGPERRRQQAHAMQPVDPLAIEAVRLGPPLDLLGVAGIHQQHFEAVAFQQFVQGDPVDPARFQGDGRDAVLPQIGKDLMQALGVRREFLQEVVVVVAAVPDADPVRARADIDAGGVRLRDGKARDAGDFDLLRLGSPGLTTSLAPPVGLLLRCLLGCR